MNVEPAWIAIDPGPHTGIAIWFPDTFTYKFETLYLGPFPKLVTLDGDGNPHLTLMEWLKENVDKYDHLIVERFEYDRDKARTLPKIDYSAAEYLGVVKLFAQKNDMADFCCQTRQAVGRNAFWNNGKLSKMSLLKAGTQYKHEMDALRHLLYHYTFCKSMDYFLQKVRAARPEVR